MKTAAHQYEDKLLELAYGELPPPEASAVESHVRSCARCSEALAEIRSVRTTMTLAPEAPPDDGLESLFAYAEQAAKRNAEVSKPQRSWFSRFAAPLAGAMALGLVAVVAVKVGTDGSMREQAVASAQAPSQSPAREEKAAARADAPPPPPAVAATPQADWKNADPKGAAEVLEGNDDRLAAATGAERDAPADKADRGDVQYRSKSAEAAPKFDGFGAKAKKPSKAIAAPATRGTSLAMNDDTGNAGRAVRKMEAADEVYANKKVADVSKEGVAGLRQPMEEKAAAEPPAPAPSQVPAAAPGSGMVASAESAPQQQQSLGLSLGGGGRGSGPYQTGEQQKKDMPRSRDTQDAKLAPSKPADESTRRVDMLKEIEGLLAQARAASAARDVDQEIRLSQQVVKLGATGSQRLEALSRMCTAYERLGEPDQATRYCNQVLSEFPDTAQARAIAQRNEQRIQRAPSKRKSQSYDYESEKAEPAAKPAADPVEQRQAK